MRRIANSEQEQAWNGYEGTYWATHQDRWDSVNAGFNAPLFAAASIAEGDRVLDIGCGAGFTTRLAARTAHAGQARGLDLSAPMLARARESAQREGLDNVAFEQADAQVHPFEPGAFDVAISRYGVMFFADPVAAFTNIAGALRAEGRLAFVCGAGPERNEWLTAMASLRAHLPMGDLGTPGGPGMFSLSDPERVRAVLAAAGFVHITVERAETRGVWGPHAEATADFLLDSGPGRHLTQQVEAEVRERARQALVDALRPYEDHDAVRLRSSAWLVTARRDS
ncbi:class I SAM-dependent methyltransferase [Streptomyces beijiangensis]|uniref:Class I SAM-dependent methyltransferase n=1 Tax=Streptomyces beijiangensis TaxID=163361 RepID=A0A939JG55_9ACTN|nr:class I SAM-dependent methyltransferase [Streptomyces beijiangensis]MBO0511187.1 class I SAM-dependent methyltransferase [Streptomyces beijiangensis]